MDGEKIVGETKRAEDNLALSIDWDLYGRALAESDLSDEDKRAFIETLWSIVVTFVDLGFQLSPTEQSCGQVDVSEALSRVAEKAVVNSENIQSRRTFMRAATDLPAPAAEGSQT